MIFESLVRDAQTCASLAEFRAHVLAAVVQEIGADSAHLGDPEGARATVADARQGFAFVAISPAFFQRFIEDRVRYDRSNRRLLDAMQSGPVIDTDVYSLGERERVAAFAEIVLPQGARTLLASVVRHRGRPIAQIVLKRHGAGARFRSGDAAALRALIPAIALADAGFQYTARAPDIAVSAPLTPREAQVVELACRGMSNREIAMLLGTSMHTVKKQMRSALEKCGASNRTELAWRRSD